MDIMVGVARLEDWRRCVAPLGGIGYIYRGMDFRGDRLFVRGPESRRTHYLHMCRKGGREWIVHLRFRDVLRRDGKTAREYDLLKRKLARKFRDNRRRFL